MTEIVPTDYERAEKLGATTAKLFKKVESTVATAKTTETNTTTAELQQKRKDLEQKTAPLSSTENKQIKPDKPLETVVKGVSTIATLAGVDPKQIEPIAKAIKESPKLNLFFSNLWKSIQSLFPSFTLFSFFSSSKSAEKKIEDVKHTQPDIKPAVKQAEEKEKSNISPLTKNISKLLSGPTQIRQNIKTMFEGSEGISEYLSPKKYTQLQKVLKLKRNETIAGGPAHKGTYMLMALLEDRFPNSFKHSAAVNDKYHHKLSYHSKHKDGLAFDYSLSNPNTHAQSYTDMKNFLSTLGLNTSGMKNEYAKLSKSGTSGHIHFEFTKSELDKVYSAFSQA